MTKNIFMVDFNGVKFAIDANTRLVKLTAPNNGAADTSYHDTTTGANYQVPTGKKATIIFIGHKDSSGSTDKIIYADNADGVTNAVTLLDDQTTTSIDNEIFISAEIPADKFINIEHGTGTFTGEQIIYIVEEDA